uniref:Uncharacterized protein n=1 Tax=Rhizophora mucronata TaxID=61149 RepID=A0A2P2Q3Z6_RHIMU
MLFIMSCSFSLPAVMILLGHFLFEQQYCLVSWL